MSEFKIFNEAIDILRRAKKLYPVDDEFLQKENNKDNLDCYLNNYVYRNLSKENIININDYLHYTDSTDESIYGVFRNNNKITTIIPYVNDLKSLLINAHEQTHLINLLYGNNKAFVTIYNEIVPVFNEYYYLYMNDEDTQSFINNLLNKCIIYLKNNNVNEVNKIAHIYASIILNYLKDKDINDYFNLLNTININSYNFNDDLKKNDLVLSKKMLKNL